MVKKRIISILLAVGLLAGTWDIVVLAQELQTEEVPAEEIQSEEIQSEENLDGETSETSEKSVSQKGNTSALASVTSVSVKSTANLAAPGTVEVSITVKDPSGNGVKNIMVDFAGSGSARASVSFFEYQTVYPGTEGKTYTKTLELSKYQPKGAYQLSFIMLESPNGDVQYTPDGSSMKGTANGSLTGDSFSRESSSFTIVSSPEGDDAAPVIKNISAGDKVWEAPGKIQVQVQITEEGSGVDSVQLDFREEKTKFELHLSASAWEGNLKKVSQDSYTMETILPENAPSGKYTLWFAMVSDKAGYNTQYGDNSFTGVSFQVRNVSGGAYDYDAPVLKSISAEKKTVKAPSLAKLRMNIEDASDIAQIYLYYTGAGGNRLDIRTNEKETYSGSKENEVYVPINQYAQAGKYELNSIEITDKAGNCSLYNSDTRNGQKGFVRYENDGTEKDFFVCDGEADITVENALSPDVRTGLGDGALAGKLSNMKEGGTAVVDAREVTEAPRAVFEAIKGKDKTLVLESEGIQWIFNGKDLNSEMKDINVFTMIEPVTESESAEYGLPEDGYKISFYPNGQLPGAAKIRINLGYEFYVRGLSGNVVLSWLNDETFKLEQVNSKVGYGQDSYAEFVITHNSVYFLSNGHVHSYAQSVTKATASRNGSIQEKCRVCGRIRKSVPIYYPKTISYKSELTYNGKTQRPSVTVKGSDGKVIGASNYKLSYSSGCKKIGHYKVTITFKGNYSGTVAKAFNINPKGTKLSKVKAAKKKATVKWKKQTKDTKGYQVQYSMDKNFKSGVKTKTVSGSKKTSVTLKGMKSKKTYYVRIRTYQNASGGKCYSSWSGAKKVKIK